VELARFDGVQTQVLGLSVDSCDSLKAWSDSLGGITYPLLSDFYPHGQVAQLYGVLRSEGYSERAIFVTDKLGIIRYVDVHDKDEQPDNEVLFRVLAGLLPPGVTPVVPAYPPPKPVAETPEQDGSGVVMYCTPWCPACKRARAFFQKYNIPFTEVDISRDRMAAQRVRSWANGYETTPTFYYQGKVVVEFNEERVATLLGIKLS
jgi:glutaredoxin